MAHWGLVVADLQQHYGIAEWQVQDAPWPWFRTLVWGLLSIPEARITHTLMNSNRG